MRAWVLAVALAATVNGCAGPTPNQNPPPPATTHTAASGPTTAPLPPDVAPAGSPRCTISQLIVTAPRGSTPGGGARYSVIGFTNKGGTCYLRGYPRLVELDANGRTVGVAGPSHIGADGAPARYSINKPVTVRLAPGQSAASIYYSAFADPEPGATFTCPRYTTLRVGVPNDPDTTRYTGEQDSQGPPLNLWLCDVQVGPIAAGLFEYPPGP